MKKKKKVVMAFGSFDVLHPGHIHFLTKARKLGDRLVVVVTRDSSYRAQKKRRPVMSERERLLTVSSLRMVDAVVLGDRGAASVIRRTSPDVIAVGYDQDPNHPYLIAQLTKMKKKPHIVHLKAKKKHRYHSSLVKAAHYARH